jgi:glucosamine--fructose-6-phosphate aminotransferase (isomerizing)
LALVEHSFPAVVIAPSGGMLPEMQAFVQTLNERGAETIIISDNEEILAMGQVRLSLDSMVLEWLSPLTAILPGQLFAMHLASSRGFDVDAPRGLQKVTETR